MIQAVALYLLLAQRPDNPTKKSPSPPAPITAPAEPSDPLLANLVPRSLGPTTMGGRITGIAVYDKNPAIFYVASASGGLFKTLNNGTTFDPVFEREGSVSLGAVAVSQSDPNLVWVGTGEATSRNSVAWGDGAYKSIDGGKSWQHMGLPETMQIGKIVIDPKHPDTVYVGALGRLWGPNPERGLYKTTDGGVTWKKILFVDDKTGVIDIAMDPRNSNTFLVAMWQRLRKPYDFSSGGPGSGIYKTTDGGSSFRHVLKGLPTYSNFGRIGLTYYKKNPRIVTALVEYHPDATKEKDKLPSDGGLTKIYAGGTFRSTDGGDSWVKVNPLDPRPFYFSLPVQDPIDENRLYVLSDALRYTDDAGKTFKVQRTSVHPDFHAFWIDPTNNDHLIAGCDGGVYVSYDRAQKWDHLNNMPIGQFYQVSADMRKPYWIYGGLQDNGCWGIPSQARGRGIAFYNAVGLDGGDGFYTQVDPTDWTTVYTESQNGGMTRTDLTTGDARGVRPPTSLTHGYRANWSTPFIISPHNPQTLYFGANYLFKSVDKGNRWKVISPDLTTNDVSKQSPGKDSVTPENTGAEKYCCIVTISESPMKQGLIWVGTDDGQIQVTQDDGATWTNVTANLPNVPANTWVSHVVASKWEEGRAYATLDGHRSNDFKPYLVVTEDYGKTWKPLTAGLPDFDCLYVVREGERNPDLLYLGSEMSLRISVDRGQSWLRFRNKFPTVAVHDLLVHPRDLDLIIGTHGRSIWTLDVSGLEGLSAEKLTDDVVLTQPQEIVRIGDYSPQAWAGDRVYYAPNSQPGTRIQYYLKDKPKGSVSLVVTDAAGSRRSTLLATEEQGLNVVAWDGSFGGRAALEGDYRITLTVAGKDYTTGVHVSGEASTSGPRPNVDEDGDDG
jgi:photosystem II stability/assembly factor-like uncharacterized protein